jgi:hypothetical protein
VKKPRLIIVLPAAILAVGIYLYFLNGRPNDEFISKVFGNRQLFDAFVASQQVSAQRLHWQDRHEITPDVLSNYKRGPSVPVPASQTRRLKRILQRSPSFYQGSNRKACIPEYGVLFTFRSGDRAIQIALCFNCNMLDVFDGSDDRARSVNSLPDFDPMRSDLVAIVKKVFPDDAEIQGLESGQ